MLRRPAAEIVVIEPEADSVTAVDEPRFNFGCDAKRGQFAKPFAPCDADFPISGHHCPAVLAAPGAPDRKKLILNLIWRETMSEVTENDFSTVRDTSLR